MQTADIVLLIQQDTQTQTQWAILTTESDTPVPERVPDYDVNFNFRKNTLVLKDGDIYLSKQIVLSGAFRRKEWTKITPLFGYLNPYDNDRDYEFDEFILRGDGKILKTKGPFPKKNFDEDDWEQVISRTRAEDAYVYGERQDERYHLEIEDGYFVELGGEPEYFNPFEEATPLEEYFMRKRKGHYWNAYLEDSVYVNASGTTLATPGDKVAMVRDVIESGFDFVQTDPALRPTYLEDATGRGYLEFSGDEHLLIDAGINRTETTVAFAVPGTGGLSIEISNDRYVRVGPTHPHANKKWHISEFAVLSEPLSSTDRTEIEMEVDERAKMRFASDVLTDLSYYFYGDTGINAPILSNWQMPGKQNLSYMFAETTAFNQNLSAWNMDSVITIEGMFKNAHVFDGPVDWKTSSLEDISEVFSGCDLFDQSVNMWDVSKVVSTHKAFHAAITFNRPLDTWILDEAIDVSFMFKDATAFDNNVSKFGLAKATTTESMFEDAVIFNQPLTNWTTSALVDATAMFMGATAFNQSIAHLDFSNVTSFNSMLSFTNAFDQPLNAIDVRKGMDFEGMFDHAIVFNQPLNSWRTLAVTNMNAMFYRARAFNQDLSSWCVAGPPSNADFDTGAGFEGQVPKLPVWARPCLEHFISLDFDPTDKTRMFQDLSRTIPVTAPGDPVAVIIDKVNDVSATTSGTRPTYQEDSTGAGYLVFPYGSSLIVPKQTSNHDIFITVPGIGGWVDLDADAVIGLPATKIDYVGRVHYVGRFFTIDNTLSAVHKAEAKRSLGLFDIYANDTVTDLHGYFYSETSFNQDLNDWDVSEVTNTQAMFAFSGFNGDISSWDMAKVTDASLMFKGNIAFNQNISTVSIPSLTTAFEMFNDAVAFNYPVTISSTELTDVRKMFMGASSFNSSVIIDSQKVTSSESMFHGASSFNKNVSFTWPILTTAVSMFEGATLFNGTVVDLIEAGVTDISRMFKSAVSFNQPLVSWDTSTVETVESMFEGAESFTQDVSGFDMSNVTNVLYMFKAALSFDGSISSWDMGSLTSVESMFEGALSFNQDVSTWTNFIPENTTKFLKGATAFDQPLNSLDVSVLTDAESMFEDAVNFDQPLNDWKTKSFMNLENMFKGATAFNQDLTSWCIEHIATEPTDFDTSSGLVPANAPNWGGVCFDDLAKLRYDFSDETKLFSDVAGTVQATAGDKVLHVLASGEIQIPLIQADPLLAPVLRAAGNGKTYLEFTDPSHSMTADLPVSQSVYESRTIPGIGYQTVKRADGTSYVLRPSSHGALGLEVGQVIVSSRWPVGSEAAIKANFSDEALVYPNGTVTSLEGYLTQVELLSDISGWRVNQVTSMKRLFQLNSTFNQDISGWSTPLVTDFSFMFSFTPLFNQDLSSWSTGSGTTFKGMFESAEVFNGSVAGFSTGQATDVINMFKNAKAFDKPVNHFVLTLATSLEGMFSGAWAFNQVVSGWDTSNITSFARTFEEARAFNQNVNTWTVTAADDFSGMFHGALVFDAAIDTWTFPNSSTLFDDMFRSTGAFNQDISGWDVALVSSMNFMFTDAGAFAQDISGWCTSSIDPTTEAIEFNDNSTLVDAFEPKFGEICLDALILGHYDPSDLSTMAINSDGTGGTPNVGDKVGYIKDLTNHHNDASQPNVALQPTYQEDPTGRGYLEMVNDDHFIAAGITATSMNWIGFTGRGMARWADVVNTGGAKVGIKAGTTSDNKVWAFTGEIVADNTVDSTNQNIVATIIKGGALAHLPVPQRSVVELFKNEQIKDGFEDFEISDFIDLTSMFEGTTIESPDLSGWDMSSVGKVGKMFKDATLFNGDVSNWDFSGFFGDPDTMEEMFAGCTSFNHASINTWGISKVHKFDRMFKDCTSFNQPLTNWTIKTDDSVSMSGMFEGCTSFNDAVAGWDVSAVTDFSDMFKGCVLFNQSIGNWYINTTESVFFDSMFEGAVAFNQDLSDWDMMRAFRINAMFKSATVFNNGSAAGVSDNPLTWDTLTLTQMPSVFQGAIAFNQNIADWRTGSVITMDNAFNGATAFDQDLSTWCVGLIASLPTGFDTNAGFEGLTVKQPVWGQFCIIDGIDFYHDPSTNGTVWQDVAGTIRANTTGDPVARIDDQTGNARHLLQSVDVQRPTYREDTNGKGYLEFQNNQTMELTYPDSADLIIGVVNCGQVTFDTLDFTSGIDMRVLFSPSTDGIHKLSIFAGTPTGLAPADRAAVKEAVNNSATGFEAGTLTSLASFFKDNATFNKDISHWDTSGVTDITSMFNNAQAFNQDINGWDMSLVTEGKSFLREAHTFNNGSAVGVSDNPMPAMPLITELDHFFDSAIVFNQQVNFTGTLTSLKGTFMLTQRFNQDLNSFNVVNVESAEQCFDGAMTFNNGGTPGTGGTHPLTWPLGRDVSLLNIDTMFSFTSAFNQTINSFNFTAVETLVSVFYRASFFNQDVSGWDTSNVTSFENLFNLALRFNQDVSGWDMSSATNIKNMFASARAFNNGSATILTNNPITWDVSNVTDMTGVFSSAVVFNQSLETWDVTNVVSFNSMFKSAEAFNVPIKRWDVVGAEDFTSMFQGAVAFDQSLGCWLPTAAENMGNMFNGATAFDQDISGWCTPGITTEPGNFDLGSAIDGTAKSPQWNFMSSCRPTVVGGSNVIAAYDLTDFANMYTDEAGTIPLTAGDTSVKALEDVTGNGHACKIVSSDGTSSAALRVDVNGKSMLQLNAGVFISLPGLTNRNIDVAFYLPGTGGTSKDVLTDGNGILFGHAEGERSIGYLVVTQNGSGDTVRGFECLEYDMTGVTFKAENLFNGDTSFNKDISDWDVTHLTSIAGMFKDASAFNQNIAAWDTSNITDFSNVFNMAGAFNNGLGYGVAGNPFLWDTSSATVMANMFSDCWGFNQAVPNFSFDSMVLGITDVQADKTWSDDLIGATGLFRYADGFDQNLNHLDWSKLDTVAHILNGCYGFTNGGVQPDWDLSNVKSAEAFFSGCASFNYPVNDLKLIKNRNMSEMFNRASIFNNGGLPLTHDPAKWDMSEVRNMAHAFNASGFNQPVDTWEVGKVTTLSNCFNANKVFNQDLTAWDTSSVTDMGYMFYAASDFANGGQPLAATAGGWNTSAVENLDSIFKYSPMNFALTGWDTSSVTNMQGMFQYAVNFNQNLDHFDTSSVTTMNVMFDNAHAFDQPVEHFDTSNVVSIGNMFKSTQAFNQPVGKWDLSGVTDITGIFSRTVKFNQPLACWKLPLVDKANYVFDKAQAFDQDISGWCFPSLSAPPFNFDTDSLIEYTGKTVIWGNLGLCTTDHKITAPSALVYYDFSVKAALFQDTNMTMPVTAPGQAILAVRDQTIEGLDLIATSNKIFYREDVNGRGYAQFTEDAGFRVSEIKTSCDLVLVIPGVGKTHLEKDADALGVNFDGTDQDFNLSFIGIMPVGDFDEVSGLDCEPYDIPGPLSLKGLFKGKSKLTGDITDWNVSEVTDITEMFKGQTDFNQNISNWDMRKVSTMTDALMGCSSFNRPIGNWNLTAATVRADGLLDGASAFDQGLVNWETVNWAGSLSRMFKGCIALNKPNGNWDLSAVTDLSSMFEGAVNFNQDISGWTINASAPVTMANMFKGATKFDNNLNGWDFSEVTDMSSMFYGTAFNNGGVSPAFNTGRVTDMSNMLAFTTVYNWPITGLTLTAVTNTSNMFDGAVLFNQDMSLVTLPAVTTIAAMFKDTQAFNNGSAAGVTGTPFSMTVNAMAGTVDMTGLFQGTKLFNQDVNGFNTSGVSAMTDFFADAIAFDNGGVSLNQSGTGFNVPSTITDLSRFFAASTATPVPFNQLLIGWDVSNVTVMEEMFKGCAFNQVIENWVVSSVTNFKGMFKDTPSFNQPLSKWIVGTAIDFSEMFMNAQSFNRPLECWLPALAEIMKQMFDGATAFDQDLSSWCTPEITSEPSGFKTDAGFKNSPAKQPDWANMGSCIPDTVIDGANIIAILNPLDKSDLWTDSIGSTNVTTAGQTVAWISDSSNQTNHGEAVGTITYREDANGKGYLEFDANAMVRVNGLNRAVDIVMNIPSVGNTAVTSLNVANPGTPMTPSAKFMAQLVFTEAGSGSTISGLNCIDYAPGTVTTLANFFNGITNFNQNVSDWNYSSIEDTSNMFLGASSFNNGGMAWTTADFSKNRNLSNMFCNTAFNQDVSDWVLNSTDSVELVSMFDDNTTFNQDLTNWDVSKVTDFSRMFDGAVSFNNGQANGANTRPLSWTIRNDVPVTMHRIFEAAKSFNQELAGWDTSSVVGMQRMFYDAIAFNNGGRPFGATWSTQAITDMNAMFYRARAFNQDISGWDTSLVTNMRYMFSGASVFNNKNVPLVSTPGGWNTSSNTSMEAMFFNASAFNQDITSWDTSAVTTMYRVFYNATAFNNGNAPMATTAGGWDTSAVTIMKEMFRATGTFNQDITSWDTSAVTDMDSMFRDSLAFNNGNAPMATTAGGWDTSAVTTMKEMFCEAISFNQDVTSWNTSLVTSMLDLFRETQAFNNGGAPMNNVAGGWDTENVTDMAAMFFAATAFDQDISGWCVTNVTSYPTDFDVSSPINGTAKVPIWGFCPHPLTRAELDTFIAAYKAAPSSTTAVPIVRADTSQITNFTALNLGSSFDLDISGWNVSNGTTFLEAFNGASSFNQDISGWDTTKATDMSSMFRGASLFDQNISGWDTAAVEDMTSMFESTTNFNGDISGWDVGNVRPMAFMFYNARNFNQDISGWDTAKVSDMDNMFQGASVFDQDLSGWCVTNVTSYPGNFDTGCPINGTAKVPIWGLCPHPLTRPELDSLIAAYKAAPSPAAAVPIINADTGSIANFATLNLGSSFNLDISGWDVSNGTTFEDAFKDASAFNQDISGWDTSKATTMTFMFSGASAFNQNIGGWDTAAVEDMSFMFENAANFNGEISGWTTDAVTTMDSMFYGANAFNVDISGWKTNLVTTMYAMFYEATSFNQDIGGWITSAVTDMSFMFYYASAFNQNIGGWNTAAVEDMTSMFESANAFSQDLIDWNVGNVTAMTFMFYEATSFNSDISGWDTENVTDMGSMFEEAVVFNQDLSSWCVTDITTLPSEFATNCPIAGTAKVPVWGTCIKPLTRPELNALISAYKSSPSPTTAAPIINGDTSEITDFSSLNLGSTFDLDISGWDVGKGTSFDYAFENARAFNQDISGWDMSSGTAAVSMFQNAVVFNQDISGWDVSNFTLMTYMFSGCLAFDQDLSPWCVSNFSGPPGGIPGFFAPGSPISQTAKEPVWGTCPPPQTTPLTRAELDALISAYNTAPSSATADPVINANTSEITDFTSLNLGAAFDLNIGGWDVGKGTHFDYAFNGASVFNQDISGWNVSSGQKAFNMFSNASAFNQDISGWDVSNFDLMTYMFSGATAFDQDLSSWCVSNFSGPPGGIPGFFAPGSPISQTAKEPVWGTCP